MKNKFLKIINIVFLFIFVLSLFCIFEPIKTKTAEAGTIYTNLINEKVYLRNQFTNDYMDVAGGGTSNGTLIQQYFFNYTISQKFKIYQISGDITK